MIYLCENILQEYIVISRNFKAAFLYSVISSCPFYPHHHPHSARTACSGTLSCIVIWKGHMFISFICGFNLPLMVGKRAALVYQDGHSDGVIQSGHSITSIFFFWMCVREPTHRQPYCPPSKPFSKFGSLAPCGMVQPAEGASRPFEASLQLQGLTP